MYRYIRPSVFCEQKERHNDDIESLLFIINNIDIITINTIVHNSSKSQLT